MVSRDITYSLPSLERAGFVGGGAQLLLEASADAEAALSAYAEVVLEANEAMEAHLPDELFGRLDGPVPTPHGPMALVTECEPAKALPILLDLVVRGLERRGVTGTLRPGREYRDQTYDDTSYPCLGMLLEPTIDVNRHLAAHADGRFDLGEGSWDPSPPDAALVTRLVAWVLGVPGVVSVRLGPTALEVSPGGAADLVRAALRTERSVVVARADGGNTRRACAVTPAGIVVTDFDPAQNRRRQLEQLLELAVSLESTIASALVRELYTGAHRVQSLVAFPPGIPFGRRAGSTVVRHLQRDYVYDAGVGQVVTGSQLGKAALPGERWTVDPAGTDRFVVVHREPERWFNPELTLSDEPGQRGGFVDGAVVERARDDFGRAILTVDTVVENSPHLSAEERAIVRAWLAG